MSNHDDKLTADTFAPAGGQSNESLAATTFEPLSQATSEKRRVSATQIAAGSAGIFVVALLFFLFTARSLTLNIVAEADPDFSLSGLNWSFGERILVRPGEYVLKVTAEGYHPYEQNITVSDADTQQLEIQLAPLPGTVTLTTQPAGAVITVDEAVLGPSPLTDRVFEAGRYAVSASLARYQRWQGELEVIGRNQSQTLDIMMVPDWAQVTFTTKPVSVTATVDGEVSEITERGVEVLSGERSLTLSAPGFMPATIPLTIVAGVDQDLGSITLTPADATLTLNSTPAGAGVSVDGTFAGPLPWFCRPRGRPHHQLSKAGYRGAFPVVVARRNGRCRHTAGTGRGAL